MRDTVLFYCDTPFWHVWGDLLHSTETGETGYQHLFGLSLFAYAQQHPELGGGHGQMLASILQTHPTLHGVLFDLPHVVKGAPPLLVVAGGKERTGAKYRALLSTAGFELTRLIPVLPPFYMIEAVRA